MPGCLLPALDLLVCWSAIYFHIRLFGLPSILVAAHRRSSGLPLLLHLPQPFLPCPCPVPAGLTKSYQLPTLDSEILQATVDKQQFAVRLTAETAAVSRLLARCALAWVSVHGTSS